MSQPGFRILGPHHNRLLIVPTVPRAETPPPPGIVTRATADQLIACGWAPYDGPATARRGWVVPGTDPTLRPSSVQVG